MAKEEIHVGDIGTVLTVTVKDGSTVVNISSATVTKNLILVDSDGSKHTKAASFVTDGTDGKLRYTTVSGDLALAGHWQLQVYLVLSSGSWHTDVGSFTVHANL